MTSDINGTVTGLQGFAISSAAPQDGYVLVWDAADGYWKPQPPPKASLQSAYFTSNGSWTCPVGVTSILLIGCGGGAGGGGGGGGSNYQGGTGGGGALQNSIYVSVTPNTNYSITVGSGGSGGSGNASGSGSNGNDGGDTSFDVLAAFCGAGGGTGGINSSFGENGGANTRPGSPICLAGSSASSITPAGGGYVWNGSLINSGQRNSIGGFVGGNAGSFTYAGSGGGAGTKGVGGNGGNGPNGATNPTNGTSASSNTGAGGGGGGGFGAGSFASVGNGGNGGSGYLYVVYVN